MLAKVESREGVEKSLAKIATKSKSMLKGTLAPATGVIEYLKAQGFDFI